ncbi:MAG: helix-turn-helix domain-containing protein [Mariprofundaceae bacterium]
MTPASRDEARSAPETAAEPSFDRATLLATLGERLRLAREARGEKIEEVVRELKLRRLYVEALEAGDWAVLPDEVYALGFLKQYAAHLGLDISGELERLRSGEVRLTRPLTYPDPPIAPSRRWAWIAGAAFVLLLIVFNVLSDQETNEAPPTSAAGQLAEHTARTTTTADDARAVATPPPSSMAPSNRPLPRLTAEPDAADADRQASSEAAMAMKSASDEPVATGGEAHRFVLEAIDEPVWLQVFLPDPYATPQAPAEHPVREALLQPGQKLRLKQEVSRIWVTTGNAGALQISIDGEIAIPAGGLGESAQVLRKVPLPPSLDSPLP